MNPSFCIRPVLAILLWLAIPLRFYAQIDSLNISNAIQQLDRSNDTTKVDLLLRISEELVKSKPRESFDYATDALELARKLKDPGRIGLSFRNLADFYSVTAVYDKALDYYVQALERFEDLRDTLRMAQCYEEIGIVHMTSDDYNEARVNFNKALVLNKAVVSHRQIATNYMNLGLNYLRADSVDKGLSYLLVSLMIADSLNMEPEKIALMNNMGYAYARLGRHEDALGHFYKVLELLGTQPDDLTRSDAQLNIAKGYYELKNYPAALKYARQSYELAKTGNFHQVLRDAAGLLSDIYAARGDYEKAYAYVKIFRDLSDTLMNADKAEQLARIRALYEVGQKEEENLSLRNQIFQNVRRVRARTLLIIMITTLVVVLAALLFLLNRMNIRYIALNRKLAVQSHEMEALNDLKDKFFSFVAHNLKNPFNTIMGFSELMNRAAHAKDLKKTREYSGLIYDLSSQVQKVLSNLLEWSRLQRRTFEVKPETVELTGLIKDVVEMNNREAARKDNNLKITGESNVYVVADRSMITAVLQNLVTNAINFTPPMGNITIDCKVDGQLAEVTITDTGIGISSEKLGMLFDFDFSQSKLGTSDRGGAGLGLVICHEMLMKNNGTIHAESEPGKGSSFTFTLPVAGRHETGLILQNGHSDDIPDHIIENLLNSEALSANLEHDLRYAIVPQYEEISRVLSIEELEKFSKMLILTGEKYHHSALAGYGKSLHSLTVGHQIDQIIKILPRFREYLKKVDVL